MAGELLKGNSDLLILAALAGGAQHGYGIARAVERRSRGEILLNDGVLYPVLHRLESDRFVTSKWSESDGRKRRIYSLTATGRKRLLERKQEWSDFARALTSVLGGGNV